MSAAMHSVGERLSARLRGRLSGHGRGHRRTASGLYCSFCGRDQSETRRLIAGPNVYICSECVALCNQIIEGERH
jgi:hypothetical protein